MNAGDVLRAKGNALYTVAPDSSLWSAVQTMTEFDIGSVVVMDHGRLAGMLTFREVFRALRANDGRVGKGMVREYMEPDPTIVQAQTDVNDLRRLMLDRRVRYIPVLDEKALAGVISFHDVARAVLEEQGYENRMLKDYIRDWPQSESVSG
ncbi:XRE family transcriptional regulator [Burkholderiales bacterium]|nr:XRE family transcriptional regulator [Burkholderiales bacterium]